MGYCYMTGKKIDGHWKFITCDGRSNICAQHGTSPPGNVPADGKDYQCKDCVEWCATLTKAKEALDDWYRINPDV